MLFPQNTSQPATAATAKRARPHDAPPKLARPHTRGPFLVGDDESDEETVPPEPAFKKRMLEKEKPVTATRSIYVDDEDIPSMDELEELQEQLQSTVPKSIATPPDEDDPSMNELEDLEELLHADPPETMETPPNSQPGEDQDAAEELERYERLFGISRDRPSFSTLENISTPPEPSRACHMSTTCSGKQIPIRERKASAPVSYKHMVAARSRTKDGRAKRSYYGIEIHGLVDNASKELAEQKRLSASRPVTPPAAHPDKPVPSVEELHGAGAREKKAKAKASMLWTEKYRARTFMDLVGDDLTNRQVLRWLKRWDPIVFPHAARARPAAVRRPAPGASHQQQQQPDMEKPHRKILMLTGPPGLGKTTLAHVCARQAGYEVMEINASDDRSRDVVRGRIRTSLGTENVRTVENKKAQAGERPKVARPVCVVVDEVDGVVTGSGGSGEGGFVKALIDLVLLDQKNSSVAAASSEGGHRRKKTDDFRQMRPLILICNDVYHPSLRPLRQSGLAEIVHVGKPTFEAVVTRLKTVFEQEGIPCEKDAARKLCEAAWGMASGIDAKRGRESTAEGDLRGVMVVGEWVAGRIKAGADPSACLTRQWIEQNVIQELAHGGHGARGLGRGGTKDIVSRIFQEGAGFPRQAVATSRAHKNTLHEQPQTQLGFAEHQKKYAMDRLREMIETNGEVERVMTEIFTEYPDREFNDDSFLSKPDSAYEWLHFHDACSSRLFSSQEWELAPYLAQPVLACHHLFASTHRHAPAPNGNAGYDKKWGTGAEDDTEAAPLPFTGPRADFAAHEAGKANRAALQAIQSGLAPALSRAFRSPEHVATDLLPYLVRLVSPDVKPVVVGGGSDKAAVASVRREGERAMVRRAAAVLADVGIALQKGRIEADGVGTVGRAQWVYRMEPDLDALATFETAGAYVSTLAPTRYAVRQVLDHELQKTIALRESVARQARFKAGRTANSGEHENYQFDDKENRDRNGGKTKDTGPVGTAIKRDFFGRIIAQASQRPLEEVDGNSGGGKHRRKRSEVNKVWVTFHEGLNNAVRKPISLEEFLRGL